MTSGGGSGVAMSYSGGLEGEVSLDVCVCESSLFSRFRYVRPIVFTYSVWCVWRSDVRTAYRHVHLR